ncbi:MAG: hypothetical protein Q9173_002041 [Seirophora scorigena]
MLLMYTAWKARKRTKVVKLQEMDLVTDAYPAEKLKPADDFERTTWKDGGPETRPLLNNSGITARREREENLIEGL